MDKIQEQKLKESIFSVNIPRYAEIPSMGLFLEQTVNYINESLSALGEFKVTSSMISNYVKMGIIANPVNKLYSRDQIAYLIYITLFKSVLSLDEITVMFALQKGNYSVQITYNYFCDELENMLAYIFGNKEKLDYIGGKLTKMKQFYKNSIQMLAYKIYVTKYIAYYKNSAQ